MTAYRECVRVLERLSGFKNITNVPVLVLGTPPLEVQEEQMQTAPGWLGVYAYEA